VERQFSHHRLRRLLAAPPSVSVTMTARQWHPHPCRCLRTIIICI